MRLLALLPAALLLAGPAAPAAAPRDAAADDAARRLARGRQIYMETTSPSGGEIVALLGEGADVPGSAVPCSGCHGRDGRGRPEGGVAPTDITWRSLTRPYGFVRATGQRVPPYDERSLARAIAEAVDPAGVSFHVAMPRYRMSPQDMADLVAFLRALGEVADPGVGAGEVRIALLLPPPGAPAGLGEAVQAAVAARFAEVERAGGLFGRRLALVQLAGTAGTAAERRARLAGQLAGADAFAAVAPYVAGADAELAGLFGQEGMPAVGPFSSHPREDLAVNRAVFYLFPGIAEQAGALARHTRTAGAARPALLAPADDSLEPAVAAVARAWDGLSPAVVRYRRDSYDPAALARDLAGREADPLLFLGAGAEAVALLRAAEALPGWRPRLLATARAADGSLAAAPRAFDGRIVLALPAPAGGATAEAEARYQALARAHGLPAEHRSAQLAALAAVEVLAAGLERCGRDLTRDGLIEKLEGLRQLATGYAPPLTFGPSRRLGARGAYLVRVDLAGGRLAPAADGWVEAD